MTGCEPGDLRVALAGAGWVSKHHLAGWGRVKHAQVVAIADPDLPRARSRAQVCAGAQAFTHAGEMLDAVQPDALDICAPPEAHAVLCGLAAERGIATLCQKPLASSLREARDIVDAAAGRMRLMVHENWRFRAPYRQVHAWLREGAIGSVRFFRLRASSAGLLADERDCLPALLRQPLLALLPRLAIGELLIHHLDVTRWLLGAVTVVSARTTRLLPGGRRRGQCRHSHGDARRDARGGERHVQ